MIIRSIVSAGGVANGCQYKFADWIQDIPKDIYIYAVCLLRNTLMQFGLIL